MKIKDLKDKSKVEEIELTIVSQEDMKEIKNGEATVCHYLAEADGENVNLTLWNEQIDKVKIGDKVKIVNGWSSTYNEEMQVSTGKFGKLIINNVEEEDVSDS